MASQDIIDWLKSKRDTVRSPAEIAQFKADLRAQLSTLSLTVPNQKPGAITLLYSGGFDNAGLYNWQIAEKIGETSIGNVRTIGQTELGKLWNTTEFKVALRDVFNASESISDRLIKTNQILDGTTQGNVRIEPGIEVIGSGLSS